MKSYDHLIAEGYSLMNQFSEVREFRVTFTRDKIIFLEVLVGNNWVPGDQFKIDKSRDDPVVTGTNLRQSQIDSRIKSRLGSDKKFEDLDQDEKRKVLLSAKLFRERNKGKGKAPEKSETSPGSPSN